MVNRRDASLGQLRARTRRPVEWSSRANITRSLWRHNKWAFTMSEKSARSPCCSSAAPSCSSSVSTSEICSSRSSSRTSAPLSAYSSSEKKESSSSDGKSLASRPQGTANGGARRVNFLTLGMGSRLARVSSDSSMYSDQTLSSSSSRSGPTRRRSPRMARRASGVEEAPMRRKERSFGRTRCGSTIVIAQSSKPWSFKDSRLLKLRPKMWHREENAPTSTLSGQSP
mmetsp:Transcript_65792/g.177084  ORF Transcript_65792/g.177084 Transcript_65792/m.177084 type:complete len:227 (+) Transcript_65792:488-1168(+)